MQKALLRAGMLFYKHRHWYPLMRLTHQPTITQLTVMQRLLDINRNTSFGIEHGFSEIRSYVQFQQKVPVRHYEMLRPYIEQQRLTGMQVLTVESPQFYAQTSGSTGKPKYIPITATTLAMYKDEQSLFSYLQYRACPKAFLGKALGIMGAAVEDQLDSGHRVGSVSGNLYQSLPKIIQTRFVLPPWVSTIADYDLKYFVMLRLALAEPNITYAGSPNPSTFMRLLHVLNERREALTRSLATGRFAEKEALQAPLHKLLVQHIRPDPSRAAYIDSLPQLTFANVWPNLQLVTTWMGGSCGTALNALRTTLQPKTKIMELGYQSTEFRGSIALQAEINSGLPPLQHHFFEFVEQSHWDNNNHEFLMLDQLMLGKTYYIIITTAAGLYRYFMNDLVEVTGFFNATPLLRFVQKGKGVTNLTGEKLYESQVIAAIENFSRRNNLVFNFYILVADEQAMVYRLFLEANGIIPTNSSMIAQIIDESLGALNIEYQAKRDSGRLAPLTVIWLKRGAFEAYKAACVRLGQREGQFKPTVLLYSQHLSLSLADYAIH